MRYLAAGPNYSKDEGLNIFNNSTKEELEDAGFEVMCLLSIDTITIFQMKLALKRLIHLHMCEQEGIACGMPTIDQWNEALDAAKKAVDLTKDGNNEIK